jgi:Phosphotransferase enzyme family
MSVQALTRHDAPLGDAIARLQADDPIPALLGRPGWTRTYGRLDPRAACYATLVYERAGAEPVRVDLYEQIVSRARELPAPLGWARLLPCREDPALPTLARAHRRHQVEKIVRYRPGKRCTMRGSKNGALAFVKVFADERGADLADEGALLYETARAGELGFAVARCLGWNGELRAIAHEALPGAPVVEALLGAGGADLAASLARALASLPNSNLAPAHRFGAAEQMARSRRYARKLAQAAPAAEGPVEALVQALAYAHTIAPDTEFRAIHGAPHPHQWLVDGDRFALVDFDRLSLGPVEIDAATFVAELDFESASALPSELVSSAFLRAYGDAVGGCDARVLAIYRAHKHLAKAFKVALSIGTAREARAHRILTRAQAMLLEAMP